LLYLSTDYPLYLLSALPCLTILQPTIIICAPLCLAILCTTDSPLYSASEITGHLFGPRCVFSVYTDVSRRIYSPTCTREKVAVGKRWVLHKAPHDCARCRLEVEHNALIDVTLLSIFFLNPYVFSRRKPATKPQLSRKRKQHCIRERRRNAAGSIGSIQAEHDQQNKNTERWHVP
jgi:hypothetical protein